MAKPIETTIVELSMKMLPKSVPCRCKMRGMKMSSMNSHSAEVSSSASDQLTYDLLRGMKAEGPRSKTGFIRP